jgi:hypothetical protein
VANASSCRSFRRRDQPSAPRPILGEYVIFGACYQRPSGVGRTSILVRVTASVRLASVPEDAESDARFVQDRLVLFGKTVFLFAVTFLVIGYARR